MFQDVRIEKSRGGERPEPSGDRPERRLNVKKIPPELRRKRINYALIPGRHNRLVTRLKEDSQFLRSVVQGAFVLLCIWIGVEFALFVKWGSGAGESFVPRPPGAEGFLPISALISLKYWAETGIINNIHPAGLFIFLAIAGIGLLLKKAFCSWLCPVGTLSEALHLLGKRLMGRNFQPPRWLDYPLRSLKYLLLLFFLRAISGMDTATLKEFIYSPYNKVADIKMFMFFAQITTFALWTIVILMVLSVFVKNFWCRYLCPYGAFLGALSWLSPLKVRRNASTCVDCELCSKACPANIAVHKAATVMSDECTSCLACVAVCPVKETLDIRASVTATKVPPWVFGLLVAGVFIAVTGLAMLTGRWQNAVGKDEYRMRFQHLDQYQHAEGRVPKYNEND